VALFLRPNAVGRILPALLIPSFGRILEHRCRMDCDLAAARLLVALHQSRRADDRFPDRLEALVPAWLPAVPADPFDGRPFRYAASKKILYAVGKDLRDSGGSTHGSADAEADRPSNRRWETDDVVYGLEEQMEPVAAGDVPAARAADTILR